MDSAHSVLPKTSSSLGTDTRQVPVLEPKQRPFHKSFSAIVGPNGSEKSNVIDALLFVSGYRANKMRQGKLSELIHSSRGCDILKESLI
ncbi:14478_t:CDS:2, partial [Funneliformis geosporum]